MRHETILTMVISMLAVPLVCLPGGCEKSRKAIGLTGLATAASSPARQLPGDPATTNQETGSGDASLRLPGMDCMLDPRTMIRRKILVTDTGVNFLDMPGGSPGGNTASWFRPYFLFGIHEHGDEPRFYQAGPTPRKDQVLGWIPASRAALWDYRVGARQYVDRDGRSPPLLVYAEKEHLIELLHGGRTTAEPIARAVPREGRNLMPWPIAQVHHETLDGKVYEMVRLLFLGEFREGHRGTNFESSTTAPVYGSEQIQRIRKNVRMLDVCFVCDNTLSTQPFIDSIRLTMEDVARQIQGLKGETNTAFGLVLYRDHVPGLMFETAKGPASTCTFPLQELATFLEIVQPLRAAEVPSMDWPEAGLDGLLDAIRQMPWRGEGLSHRVIVLIGDNSFHAGPGSPRNPRQLDLGQIIELARSPENHVTIFGLCIDGAGGEEEQALHRAQFEKLATATGGVSHPLGDSNKVVERIRSILETEAAVVHERSRIVEARATGRLDELIASKDIDPHQVTAVMEFLRDFGNVELGRIGPDRPTFASGWVLTGIQGVPTIEKYVYVARAELDYLIGELNHVIVGLSPGFATGVLDLARRPRTGDYDQPETWSARLQALGVPCGTSSILNFTPEQAAHMPEEQRAILRERIARNIIPRLVNARNDNDAFQFIDDLEFGWVKEDLFP